MAKMMGSHPAVADLARALGYADNMPRSIELHMRVDDVVTATVEHFVTDEQLQALTAVVRKYRLVLAEDIDEESAA
jgi:hypothetical protein